MSGTSMTREMGCCRGLRLGPGRPAAGSLNAMKSAFLAHDVRDAIADQIINGFTDLRGDEDED